MRRINPAAKTDPNLPIIYPNGHTLSDTESCIHKGKQIGSYGGG